MQDAGRFFVQRCAPPEPGRIGGEGGNEVRVYFWGGGGFHGNLFRLGKGESVFWILNGVEGRKFEWFFVLLGRFWGVIKMKKDAKAWNKR